MQQFRQSFKKVPKDVLTWFPGHMNKGLRQMQQKLKTVDLVIEVHDARIPFSGRNQELKNTVTNVKPHILVLNKKDLIDPRLFGPITKQIREDEEIEHVLFTNCKDHQCQGVRRIMPLAKKLIVESERYNRAGVKEFCMMIIGVPNVGKSSIINVLRNRHLKKTGASQVGGVAGITRSVLNRIKIAEEPKTYLIDTPGILMPSIKDTNAGLKLALCACSQDHLVGDILIADYLLYRLNLIENFDYVELMGLHNPTDDIDEVLIAGAKKLETYQKVKTISNEYKLRLNLEVAAKHFLKHFRTGSLGKIFLDNELLRRN